jgi:hypothetical protein
MGGTALPIAILLRLHVVEAREFANGLVHRASSSILDRSIPECSLPLPL